MRLKSGGPSGNDSPVRPLDNKIYPLWLLGEGRKKVVQNGVSNIQGQRQKLVPRKQRRKAEGYKNKSRSPADVTFIAEMLPSRRIDH